MMKRPDQENYDSDDDDSDDGLEFVSLIEQLQTKLGIPADELVFDGTLETSQRNLLRHLERLKK